MDAGTRAGGAMEGAGVPKDDVWEVSDAGVPPARLTREQVLALVAHGRLGFRAQARRPGEAWGPAMARPEFGFGFPHLNFATVKHKGNEAIPGLAAINPNFHRVVDLAHKIAADPKAANLGFWFSAHVEWAPTPIVRRTQLFPMWDGVYVAPIVESSTVLPNSWLNVYLAAFNLTDKEQVRTMAASDSPILDDQRANLSFRLPPWGWTVQRVAIPAYTPGEHKVSFRTRSGAERAATAVAVGVLTLGSFVYAPGAAGFTLTYRIVQPEVAKTIEDWRSFAVQVAEKRLAAARATGIADGAGYRLPTETTLQQFRSYVTPSLVLAVLGDKEHPPENTVPTLFDDFVFDAVGVDGAEKAFAPGPQGPPGPPARP